MLGGEGRLNAVFMPLARVPRTDQYMRTSMRPVLLFVLGRKVECSEHCIVP